MFQDVINSIKVTLHERFSNPLLGSLLISIAAFNYHFFIIVFSEVGVVEKFKLLDMHFSPSDPETWLRLLIYPVLMALGYIFVLPYPSKLVYEFVRSRQREILEIRRKTESEFPLTREEARELRGKHFELESFYERILADKDQEILSLRAKKSADGVNSANIELKKDLEGADNREIKIWDSEYNLFVESKARRSFESDLGYLFSGTLSFTQIQDFGELAALGLVENDPEGKTRITEKGKYFARKLKQQEIPRMNDDFNTRNAIQKFNRLLAMVKTLTSEMTDPRKLSYNNSRISDFLKENLPIIERYLPAEMQDLKDVIIKNCSIINSMIHSRSTESVGRYVREMKEAINAQSADDS